MSPTRAELESTQSIALATANVPVLGFNGDIVTLRALLDSGTQSSFLSEIGCRKLESRRLGCNTEVTGMGVERSRRISGVAELQVLTSVTKRLIHVKALIMPTITGILPTSAIDVTGLKSLQSMVLADDKFHIPARIDLLLGADVYLDVVQPGVTAQRDGLLLVNTVFGWAVYGPIIQQRGRTQVSSNIITLANDLETVRKFQDLEECQKLTTVVEEDEQNSSTTYYRATTSLRDASQQYHRNKQTEG
jgi:hypothetical protein